MRKPSKTCGFIAYPVDYTTSQQSDYGADFEIGDMVTGYIETVFVTPYTVNGNIITKCTVPVFCSKEDPVEYEIALEKAVIQAGKVIDPKHLQYGGIEKINQPDDIPKNCLVVKTLKTY